MAVVEHHFRAMASAGLVQLVDGDLNLAQRAERRAQDLEARWSRFLPTSDVSRLNRAGGAEVRVTPETIELVRAMTRAWELTERRYDPTVLPLLVALGYQRSVEDLERRTLLDPDATPLGDLHAIEIDAGRSTVALPRGMALDPGGIGKGLAADMIAAELIADGARGALVSIGGDLGVAGRAPDEGWLVVVEAPDDPDRALVTLAIDHGGIATSSTLSRRWATTDATAGATHHLIDPGSGRASSTDLWAVTVIAGSGMEAEAIATEALLAGSSGLGVVLDRHGVDGVAVTDQGALLVAINARQGL